MEKIDVSDHCKNAVVASSFWRATVIARRVKRRRTPAATVAIGGWVLKGTCQLQWWGMHTLAKKEALLFGSIPTKFGWNRN